MKRTRRGMLELVDVCYGKKIIDSNRAREDMFSLMVNVITQIKKLRF